VFYGLLAGTPYKWLDLPSLLSHIVRVEHPDSTINGISFFTSGVTSNPHAQKTSP
jgi:hypothetical protein